MIECMGGVVLWSASLREPLFGLVDCAPLCNEGIRWWCRRCMACRHQDMALRRQGTPQYLTPMVSLQGMAMGLPRHLPILATQQLPSSRPTRSNNQVCCLSSCIEVCMPMHTHCNLISSVHGFLLARPALEQVL